MYPGSYVLFFRVNLFLSVVKNLFVLFPSSCKQGSGCFHHSLLNGFAISSDRIFQIFFDHQGWQLALPTWRQTGILTHHHDSDLWIFPRGKGCKKECPAVLYLYIYFPQCLSCRKPLFPEPGRTYRYHFPSHLACHHVQLRYGVRNIQRNIFCLVFFKQAKFIASFYWIH